MWGGRRGGAGARAAASVRSPAGEIVGALPYTALQRVTDPSNPHGAMNYSTASFLRGPPDDATDALVLATARPSSPQNVVAVIPGGGAAARIPDDAMACGQRGAPFNVHIGAKWSDPSDSGRKRPGPNALKPYATGSAFLNFIGDEGSDRVRAAFGPNKYRRLVALKDRYDPDNLFRVNHNISPSAHDGGPAPTPDPRRAGSGVRQPSVGGAL